MEKNKPSVLVTGASGFLGSHIARTFEENGYRVLSIDLLSMEVDGPNFTALLRGEKPQVLVHAAGGASVPFSMENPREDFASGPNLLSRLLETLRVNSPKTRVIFLSSAAVYGDPTQLPVSESAEIQPISPYGYHKVMSEMVCTTYSKLYGVPTAIARIFSAYGEGLHKQVLWDLCSRLIVEPAVLSLKGTGMESRDFLHAQDVSRGILAIATHGSFEADIYNLASGKETPIREIAELLIAEFGEKSALEFDGIQPDGNPKNWRADITKLSALNFSPAVNLEQGVKDYVKWFMELPEVKS
ncbi:MAG: NAD-dependent epimerase/dehydratase family protein [Chthoniobacterales bacterium]